MRIFVVVRHSLAPRYYYGGLWSGNFYPALRELGHEIVESQVDLLPASRFMHVAKDFTRGEREVRVQITQQIVEEVERAHREKPIDLFLSYFYNAHFDPSGFDEIHKLGIPTVNFYCNSMYQFEFVSEIAKKVKFSWHTERDARPLYLKVGANPIWVQMGANPEMYFPIPETLRQAKACFVGQRYADRDRYLARLIENQIPVDIFGSGWERGKGRGNPPWLPSRAGTGARPYDRGRRKSDENGNSNGYLGRKPFLPGTIGSYLQSIRQNFEGQGILGGARRTLWQFQYRTESRRLDPILAQTARGPASDVCRTFNEYEVVLNFNNVWSDGRPGSKLIPHVRLRDFEAPMCRSCYLPGHSEEIAEFYETGKEIDTYRTPEELADKTRFYLSHPAEAEKLRQAGYERARRHHTWVNRFRALFRIIALS